jgi:hypothetical protein
LFLADTLLCDLNECQKLCEQLRSPHPRHPQAQTLAGT